MISSPARGQQCVQYLQQEGSSTGNQEFAIRSNVSRRQFSSCTAAADPAAMLWQKSPPRSGLCIWNLSVIIRATLRFITCDLSQQFKYNHVGKKENCKTRRRFCVNSNRNSFVLWFEGRLKVEVFYTEAWIVLCIFLCSSDKTSARQMAFVQGSELKNITYSIICQLPAKHTWNRTEHTL